MAGRRRRVSPGGLAGWLFADLALVLAFVFLDSSTPGQAHGKDPSKGKSTTTTIAATTTTTPGTKGNGGARPKPYDITISVSLEESASSLNQKVDAALKKKGADVEGASVQYLVVIANGGSRGGHRSTGSDLAKKVCSLLESHWKHVVKGTTFFVTGDDSKVSIGDVNLQLFPTQMPTGN